MLLLRVLAAAAAEHEGFTVVEWRPPGLPAQPAPRADDLDGDGRTDAMVRLGDTSLVVYVGGQILRVTQTFRARSLGREATLGGDVDGDGFADLVLDASGSDDRSVSGSVWVVAGGPGMTPYRHRRLDPPGGSERDYPRQFAVAGDLDGDGRAEIVTWSQARKELYVYFGGALDRPGGRLTLGRRLEFGGLAPLGDVDGDGLDDLWLRVSEPREHMRGYILHGGPTARIEPGPAFRGHHVLATADLDGDHRREVLTFRDLHHLSAWGRSPFGWLRRWEVSVEHLSTVAAADLDGDGRDEVIAGCPDARGGKGEVRIYGPFGRLLTTLADPQAGGHYGLDAAAVGDVDGDGHPDLLLGGTAARLVGDPVGAAQVLGTWRPRGFGLVPQRPILPEAAASRRLVDGPDGAEVRGADGVRWSAFGAAQLGEVDGVAILVGQDGVTEARAMADGRRLWAKDLGTGGESARDGGLVVGHNPWTLLDEHTGEPLGTWDYQPVKVARAAGRTAVALSVGWGTTLRRLDGSVLVDSVGELRELLFVGDVLVALETGGLCQAFREGQRLWMYRGGYASGVWVEDGRLKVSGPTSTDTLDPETGVVLESVARPGPPRRAPSHDTDIE